VGLPLSAGAQTTITVDAGTTIATINHMIYGNNAQVYSGSNNGTDTAYNTAMQISGCKNIRWPGGSYADQTDWSNVACYGTWAANTSQFISFLQAFGGYMQPIVNFGGYWCSGGTGSQIYTQFTHAQAVSLAEAWVTWNMTDTGSARAQYWEVGNESYGTGSWEKGPIVNGTQYGQQFVDFYNGMKAIDSSISVGAVALPSSTQGGGWTPAVLAACKAATVIPDFLIIHNYPEGVTGIGATYDAQTLGALNIPSAQVTVLNNIISSSLGASYVGQVKYMMTEYNSSLGPSIQTVEYLNAMFVSQWILECAKSGWIGANLWATKNGTTASGGDFGFLGNTDDPHPDYYVFPLLTGKFGTQMVSCSSSGTPMVRAYAAWDNTNDLTLFLANNSPTAATTATINISGFYPQTNGNAWVLLPQGSAPVSAPQEAPGIQINGTANPAPSALAGIAGASQVTAPSFAVTLQPSEMYLLVIPQGPTPTPTATLTPTSTPTPCGYPGNTCTPTSTFTPTATPLPQGPAVAMPNILANGQNLCTFKVPEPGATLRVYLYTIAGELVTTTIGQSGSSQCVWDSAGMASGLYLVRAKVSDYDGTFRWQRLKVLVLR